MEVMRDYRVAPAAMSGAAGAIAIAGADVLGPEDEGPYLSALWTELVGGLCKISQTLFTPEACAVVVVRGHRSLAREHTPLPERHARILERALLEGARKSVAMDLGLCPSSIAEILRQAFALMGLFCWASRIPLPLVLAAHAHRSEPAGRPAQLIVARNQRLLRQTVGIVRPDNELSTVLPPAEFAVVRLLVEGKSYAEMALCRGTSQRTVANQVASAFRRLGISGRAELLCFLARSRLTTWQTSTEVVRPLTRISGAAAAGFLRVAGRESR